MNAFVAKHRSKINGVLECFDRVILRGHLPMASCDYFAVWLRSKQIALNLKHREPGWWTFKEAAPCFATQLKTHAQTVAASAGRPYKHLSSHQPMEEQARAVAERDDITDGLVCVYGTMETCQTFRVRFEEKGPNLGPDRRVCLVIYYYYMDRDFGLMHVKLQTWFPFTAKIYVNGHEWLARKLSQRGIDFKKVDNTFIKLADFHRAAACAKQFWRRDWPKFLDCLASRVNPLLKDWLAGQSYYWVIDQAEYSTDVLFADRNALATLRPALYEHAAPLFRSATGDDVLGT